METAYTNANGRTNPDFTNLHAGDLSGQTLIPGLYKYTTNVGASTSFTLDGGPSDVWIFQITGQLTLGVSVKIQLSGGAQVKNIFWAVAGSSTFGASSHFSGIILDKTDVNLQNKATLSGRILSQTAVNLDDSTITEPITVTPSGARRRFARHIRNSVGPIEDNLFNCGVNHTDCSSIELVRFCSLLTMLAKTHYTICSLDL